MKILKDRALLCPDCGSKFFSLQKCLRCVEEQSWKVSQACWGTIRLSTTTKNWNFFSHDRKQHTGVREWECTKCRAEVTDIKVTFKANSEKWYVLHIHIKAKSRLSGTYESAQYREGVFLPRMWNQVQTQEFACQTQVALAKGWF